MEKFSFNVNTGEYTKHQPLKLSEANLIKHKIEIMDERDYKALNESRGKEQIMENKKLTSQEIEELKNISDNQPVFAGKLISKESARSLIEKKLIMTYEGDYVLTEAGKTWIRNFKAAEKIRDSGILYKNQ